MFDRADRRMDRRTAMLMLGFIAVLALTAAWALSSPPAAASPAAPPSYPLPLDSVTPSPTPCEGNYTYTASSGVIVPGTNLVPGSQCGMCTTYITLPFAFNFYGQSYNGANLSNQGYLQFNTSSQPTPFATVCPLPNTSLGPAILPHWASSLGTGWHNSCHEDIGSPCGIYTSTTGLAPDRIFNIEWRAQFVSTSQHTAQFEVRLHEGSNEIEFIYGWVSYVGGYGAIGLQDGGARSTTYACNVWGSVYPGVKLTWTPPPCGPPTPTPTSTPVPDCTLAWNIVPSPLVQNSGFLYALAAIAPGDIWAVGRAPYPSASRVFTIHWDGSSWSIVPAPVPPRGYFPTLRGVSALSNNDVWAVGISSTIESLTLHWNGAAWSIVPSPNPGGNGANYLAAVEAASTNDVWAVGYFSDQLTGRPRALFLHWNGSAWSVVQGSDPAGAERRLYGIEAVANDDIWAGGAHDSRSTMFHWNGSVWSEVAVPDIGQINSISVLTVSDIWAVGEGGALHWNGSAWSLVPSPVTPLYGVHALASGDVWAVGPGAQLAHWDGSAWYAVPNPRAGILYDVTSASPTELWAVGYHFYPNYSWQTLTERAIGSCGTPTSTPIVTPSNTPVNTPTGTSTPTIIMTHTPSATAVPSGTGTSTVTVTGTRSPTGTPCVITFTDVRPADYFYEPVRYLYCARAITGYADGTFRPYNSTTRGQLTKIVVLGFDIPIYVPPQPTFADLPTTHTFYQYVETAVREGLVSGYADGTFRPQNNVTRGQLSKIVVRAAGWQVIDPATPSFTDVPATHTFYRYIETAYAHSIISGYADGTFRPQNDATRGQIARIVYNAIVGP